MKRIFGLPIALQTWSLGNVWSDDIITTLKEIKKAGITAIEVSVPCRRTRQGYRGAIEKVATSCQELKLEVLGYHAPALIESKNEDGTLAADNNAFLDSQLEEIRHHCKVLGTANVTIMDQKWYTSEKYSFYQYAKLLNDAARKLKDTKVIIKGEEEEINVYFHVYQFNLQKKKKKLEADPKSELEILLSKTDPELVGIQLDTYWLADAGYKDPSTFFEQVFGDKEPPQWTKERCLSIHLGNLPKKRNDETGAPTSCVTEDEDTASSHGKVGCKAWLDFISKNNRLGTTAGVQNVILEFMPSTFKPEAWGKKGDPILQTSVKWMEKHGTM